MQKKAKGGSGVECSAEDMSSGEHVLDLGENNPEPETSHGVALGLPGVGEGLKSQSREGAEVVMMELQASDDTEQNKPGKGDLCNDAEALHRCDESVGPALDEGYKDRDVPVELELENAISLPYWSSGLADNKELPSAEGGWIDIGTVQDLGPKQEEAIGNLSVSDLANDAENRPSSSNALHEQTREMFSPKGNFALPPSFISDALVSVSMAFIFHCHKSPLGDVSTSRCSCFSLSRRNKLWSHS